MSKTWKDFLLRSGLPLENDVHRFLEEYGCVGGYEYSYFREDEKQKEKEFSYDIDASYIKGHHFFELMIECKYRHPTTSWIFTPGKYGGAQEVRETDFLHPIDYFIDINFPYGSYFPRQIGPPCTKGIEITNNGNNEKSITQAIMQLSYAMPKKIAIGIEHQIYNLLSSPHIFYYVPIIITTSFLYRLRDDVSISQIEAAANLEDVAEKHDILVLNNKTGVDLEKYSRNVYEEMREMIGNEILEEKNRSFAKDLDHLFSVLSEYYSCRSILIVHHDKKGKNVGKIISYLDSLISPSKKIFSEIREHEEKMKKMMKDFGV